MDPATIAVLANIGLGLFGLLNARYKILDKLGIKPKDESTVPIPAPSPTEPEAEPATPFLDLADTFTKGRPILNLFVRKARDLRKAGLIDDRAAERMVTEVMAEAEGKE